MAVHEYESHDAQFRYVIRCAEYADGWKVDAAQIMRRGEALLPKRRLEGTYPEESKAIERGVRWCEVIVAHLTTDRLPNEY